MREIYQKIGGGFYDEAVSSPNPFSQGYHRHRYWKVREYVGIARVVGAGSAGGSFPEMKILDVGCGSCAWNTEKLPVVGMDISENLMKRGLEEGRIKKAVVGDLNGRLPFEDSSFDAVVMTEVLEHMEKPGEKLKEIGRVLKKGGALVLTVPFDIPLGLWWPLFAVQCFYMGKIRGQEYYRKECGHVNHFDGKKLALLLGECGFGIEKMEIWMRFNISVLARKR